MDEIFLQMLFNFWKREIKNLLNTSFQYQHKKLMVTVLKVILVQTFISLWHSKWTKRASCSLGMHLPLFTSRFAIKCVSARLILTLSFSIFANILPILSFLSLVRLSPFFLMPFVSAVTYSFLSFLEGFVKLISMWAWSIVCSCLPGCWYCKCNRLQVI